MAVLHQDVRELCLTMRLLATLLLCMSAVFTLVWIYNNIVLHQTATSAASAAGAAIEDGTSGKWPQLPYRQEVLPMWRSLLSKKFSSSKSDQERLGSVALQGGRQPVNTNCYELPKEETKFLHVQNFHADLTLVSNTLRSLGDLAVATKRMLIPPVIENAHFHAQDMPLAGSTKVWTLPKLLNVDKLLLGGVVSPLSLKHRSGSHGPCAHGWDVLVAFLVDPVPELTVHPSGLRSVHVDHIVSKSAQAGNSSSTFWDCTEAFLLFLEQDSSLIMRCHERMTVTCVDGRNLESLQMLEDDIFLNATCVNVLSWSGKQHLNQMAFVDKNPTLWQFGPAYNGNSHFSSVKVSKSIQAYARQFRSGNLGMLYVAIYCAAVDLALADRKASMKLRPVVKNVISQVKKLLESSKSMELLLVTDMPRWEAVTTLGGEPFRALQVARWHVRHVNIALRPVTLSSVKDPSVRHLMEYELLGSADYLITIGREESTEWITKEFERRHPKYVFTSKNQWHYTTQ